jgi:SsrA-binding protein
MTRGAVTERSPPLFHLRDTVSVADEEKLVADNRRAFYDYHIDERIEAGLALTGSEIKSIRAGRVNLREGYARIERGEAWLIGVHIAPWSTGGSLNHEPLRKRKLLLHRAEIVALGTKAAQKGATLVPLRLYLKDGRAKLELGLARGKRKYDKREAIKRREMQREMEEARRRELG